MLVSPDLPAYLDRLADHVRTDNPHAAVVLRSLAVSIDGGPRDLDVLAAFALRHAKGVAARTRQEVAEAFRTASRAELLAVLAANGFPANDSPHN